MDDVFRSVEPAMPLAEDPPAASSGPPAFDREHLGQVVLVCQGGGALDAYQGGVYQALAEAEVAPDWVIGTSIGAINAALFAGNKPDHWLARLAEFQSDVRQGGFAQWLGATPFIGANGNGMQLTKTRKNDGSENEGRGGKDERPLGD